MVIPPSIGTQGGGQHGAAGGAPWLKTEITGSAEIKRSISIFLQNKDKVIFAKNMFLIYFKYNY